MWAVETAQSINKAHKNIPKAECLKAYLTAKHLCDGVKSSFFRNIPREEDGKKKKNKEKLNPPHFPQQNKPHAAMQFLNISELLCHITFLLELDQTILTDKITKSHIFCFIQQCLNVKSCGFQESIKTTWKKR